MDVSVNKKDNAQVEIAVELPAEQFQEYRSKAIAEAGKDVDVQGFRPGNVPENVLEQKLGEESILGHMAEIAINDTYPKVLQEQNIDAIGKPEVKVTKLAKDGPLGFTITVATMPEVDLPDYVAEAKSAFAQSEAPEVTEQEIEDTINEIKQRHAHSTPSQTGDTEGESAESDTEGEGYQDHSHELPELTDEFVKSLGDFENVDDFKQKIVEGIRQEKQKKEEDSQRMNLIEQIIEKASIAVPDVLIEGELDRMMSQFEGQVSQAGGSLDSYLEQTGKSREEMRNEWRSDAEKRVKAQLVLNKIAAEKDIHADEQQVEQELQRMKEQYGEEVDADRLRGYIEMVLTNEAVFSYLKNQAADEENGNKEQEDQGEKEKSE